MGLDEEGKDSLAAGTGDGEIAGLLLCCHEPGGKGADETEERSQGRGDGVLLAPQEGKCRGKDCRGDDDSHQEIEICTMI